MAGYGAAKYGMAGSGRVSYGAVGYGGIWHGADGLAMVRFGWFGYGQARPASVGQGPARFDLAGCGWARTGVAGYGSARFGNLEFGRGAFARPVSASFEKGNEHDMTILLTIGALCVGIIIGVLVGGWARQPAINGLTEENRRLRAELALTRGNEGRWQIAVAELKAQLEDAREMMN